MPRKKHHYQHAEEVSKWGRVKLVGLYKGTELKTRYFCLTHYEIHEANPSGVRCGGGLKCCNREAVQQANRRKFEKSRIEYDAYLRKSGKIVRLGEYKGIDTKILHRCNEHSFEDYGRPADIKKGHGLVCCRNATTRRFSHHEHADMVLSHGRAKIIGQYVHSDIQARYFCLKHYEVHYRRAHAMANGGGLRCCANAALKEHGKRKFGKAKLEYDKKLERFGKLRRIDEYQGADIKIEHVCLVHGFRDFARPADAIRGIGLVCCQVEGSAKSAKQSNAKAKKEFLSKLARINPKMQWISGEYEHARSVMRFRCLEHNFEGESYPNRVLDGQGLKCCLIANARKIGLQYGGGSEHVWQVLIGEPERTGRAYLYLYESKFADYNKYGITGNLPRRKKMGGYGKSLIKPLEFAHREDALLVEQAFKFNYGIEPPSIAHSWVGNTELTRMHANDFERIVKEYERQISDYGRWAFAEGNCDLEQIRIAEEKLKVLVNQLHIIAV